MVGFRIPHSVFRIPYSAFRIPPLTAALLSQSNPSVGPPDAAQLRNLALIRFALMVGLALFGGVTWWLHRQPDYVPTGGADALRKALPVVFAPLVLALFAFRLIVTRARDAAAYPSQAIRAWALGEGAGIAGGVYYYLTDNPAWYVGGLILMAGAMVLFPLRVPE